VVRRCVCSGNLKNEEAMTRVGSQLHRKKNCNVFSWKYYPNSVVLFSDSYVIIL